MVFIFNGSYNFEIFLVLFFWEKLFNILEYVFQFFIEKMKKKNYK